MAKNLLLLTPLYICIFWTIILNAKTSFANKASLFLGKFMIAASVIYLSHLCYFAPLQHAYYFLDPVYQLAMLSVYPLFHIYIRILTIDTNFSSKKHGKYLIPAVILFTLYGIGVISTPDEEYKKWITDRSFHSPSLLALQGIYIVTRIVFLLEVVYTVRKNYYLIKKYGYNAKEYYADIDDSSTKKAKIINTAMLITGISSIILCVLGREFFINNIYALATASAIFSCSLFTIGKLGLTQKIINPFKETENIADTEQPALQPISNATQKEIVKKIEMMFKDKHIYMHNKFNIADLARAVGTNRTYISAAINQTYGVNFSNFVNQHRLKALENAILSKNNQSLDELAELSGFGSIDSMKRAVRIEYSKTFREWRRDIIANKRIKTIEKTERESLITNI